MRLFLVCVALILAMAAPAKAVVVFSSPSTGVLLATDDTESTGLGFGRFGAAGEGNDTISFTTGSNDMGLSTTEPPQNCSGNVPGNGPFTQVDCAGYDRPTERVILAAGGGDDTLDSVGAASPTLTEMRGQGGIDTLSGGLGPDLLDPGPEPGESVSGGGGLDVLSYAGRSAPVTASLDGVANDGQAGENDDVAGNVEAILGSPFADNLSSPTAATTTLNGGGGADTLVGGPGANTIVASGAGSSRVSCGGGSDTVFADSSDVVAADCERVVRPAQALPAPVLGKSFNLARVTGTVFVKLPGAKKVPLTAAAQVPSGALVYAEKGRVTVTADRKGKGATDVFTFFGGTFALKQSTRTGITETVLRGGSFKSCRAKRSIASASAKRRKRVRRLFGRGKGRFRTRGRYGSATVRGTAYSVTDRCDGTALKVTEGGIRARSFKLDKTVVLSVKRIKGKRFKRAFLAPARRPSR